MVTADPAPDVTALVERIDALEERVAELEAQLDESGGTATDGYGDHRDQAVLDCFEPDAEVGLAALRKLYRSQTDVTNGRTIKRRVKALTTDGPFEHVGQSRWRYTGGDVDE